jgi:hypothetical protein
VCLVPAVEIVEADPVRECRVGNVEALAPLGGHLGVHAGMLRAITRRDVDHAKIYADEVADVPTPKNLDRLHRAAFDAFVRLDGKAFDGLSCALLRGNIKRRSAIWLDSIQP